MFRRVDILLAPATTGLMTLIGNMTGHPCLTIRAGFAEMRTREMPAYLDAEIKEMEGPTRTVPFGITIECRRCPVCPLRRRGCRAAAPARCRRLGADPHAAPGPSASSSVTVAKLNRVGSYSLRGDWRSGRVTVAKLNRVGSYRRMRSRYMRVSLTELSCPPAIQADWCLTGEGVSSFAWGNVGAMRGMFIADCAGMAKPGQPRVEQRGGRQRMGQLHRPTPKHLLDLFAQVVPHLRTLGVGIPHAE